MDDARTRRPWTPARGLALLLACLAVLLAPAGARAFADDAEPDPPADGRGLDAPEGDEGEDDDLDAEAPKDPRDEVVELRALDDKEAKALAEGLSKASRRKDPEDVNPALDAIEGVTHASFVKPLLKLMAHDNSRVAQRAADLLAQRATIDDVKDLWKKGWDEKANRRRYAVRTSILKAFARLELDLDKRQYEDVEREWRWMLGNPQEAYGPALADICWYMGVRGDKRHALAMAKELDAPESNDPHNPATPPVEWWERRWKQWKGMHAQAVAALKRLTGQTFKTREEAKTWFTANEASFGVPWKDW
ncbi:MAG: hypothetical protein AB7T63_12785 [Planctomycetota bacterium]